MVTHGAQVKRFIKSDSLLTVNLICLYRLIFAPTATVYYHVERTIYIKRDRQIPHWLFMILSAFFKTAIAGYALSLLELEYFTHFDLSFYQ